MTHIDTESSNLMDQNRTITTHEKQEIYLLLESRARHGLFHWSIMQSERVLYNINITQHLKANNKTHYIYKENSPNKLWNLSLATCAFTLLTACLFWTVINPHGRKPCPRAVFQKLHVCSFGSGRIFNVTLSVRNLRQTDA